MIPLIFEKLQPSTHELHQACNKWGMKINTRKCKVLTPQLKKVSLDGVPIDIAFWEA